MLSASPAAWRGTPGAVVGEVGQGQVAGIHRIDVEVDDQARRVLLERRQGRPCTAGTIRLELVVGEPDESGTVAQDLCSEGLRVGLVSGHEAGAWLIEALAGWMLDRDWGGAATAPHLCSGLRHRSQTPAAAVARA
jgi:hypothetical protein